MRANPVSATWADKLPSDELTPFIEPFAERRWLRVLLFSVACATGFALAVAAGFHARRVEDRRIEVALQRRSLEALAASPEFVAFARALDARFVALHNAIATQPDVAETALPEIAAWEKQRGLPAWASERMPQPASIADDPARVQALLRTTCRQLAQRGHACAAEERTAARALFVGLLGPHARAFLRRAPTHTFLGVLTDVALQDIVLAAYAAHRGPAVTIAEIERQLALLAVLAPAFARAEEQARAPAPTFAVRPKTI